MAAGAHFGVRLRSGGGLGGGSQLAARLHQRELRGGTADPSGRCGGQRGGGGGQRGRLLCVAVKAVALAELAAAPRRGPGGTGSGVRKIALLVG